MIHTWLIPIKSFTSLVMHSCFWLHESCPGLGRRQASGRGPRVGHYREDMATEQSMLIPHLAISVQASVFKSVLRSVVQTIGYRSPMNKEKVATSFVCGKDVFISLPTGSAKSLCYACLPRLFNELRGARGHFIAVVFSPLSSLMQNEVRC